MSSIIILLCVNITMTFLLCCFVIYDATGRLRQERWFMEEIKWFKKQILDVWIYLKNK